MCKLVNRIPPIKNFGKNPEYHILNHNLKEGLVMLVKNLGQVVQICKCYASTSSCIKRNKFIVLCKGGLRFTSFIWVQSRRSLQSHKVQPYAPIGKFRII